MEVISAVAAAVVEARAPVVIDFEQLALVHCCPADEPETRQDLNATSVLIQNSSH